MLFTRDRGRRTIQVSKAGQSRGDDYYVVAASIRRARAMPHISTSNVAQQEAQQYFDAANLNVNEPAGATVSALIDIGYALLCVAKRSRKVLSSSC